MNAGVTTTRPAVVLFLTVLVSLQTAAQQPPVKSPEWAVKQLRAGIIGTDTSHVPALTKIFQSRPEWKINVVAAFKGGSPDLPQSASRLEGFARTIRDDYGVELVDSIDALLSKVDVVLLESVDGRTHLAQVAPVLKAGKRVFIDKPLAASLDDARRIVQLSRDMRTPFFSTSSTRFHPDIPRLRDSAGVGKITRVQASYVLNPLAFHPDLFFYGIHGVEALYTVMGTGCTSVTRTTDGDADISTCTWKDGRVGVYRGTPRADPAHPLLTVTGETGEAAISGTAGYDALALAIAEFFHTGQSPVDVAQTLEVFEFMTAAQLSKERGGAAVPLAELRK
ncbi:MAG TPA: Gfo/Idh/MocA family oxidoreductase [Gemmatimonadaceae bacterium]|nr:Gfo/Idh/MocA family oxidoreductase [Gemmatimonadaceae bacterium]